MPSAPPTLLPPPAAFRFAAVSASSDAVTATLAPVSATSDAVEAPTDATNPVSICVTVAPIPKTDVPKPIASVAAFFCASLRLLA